MVRAKWGNYGTILADFIGEYNARRREETGKQREKKGENVGWKKKVEKV